MSDFDIKYCMENGERIARVETLLKTLVDREPCYQCKNQANIAKMILNIRIINWVGGIICSGTILAIIRSILNKVSYLSQGGSSTLPF